MSAAEANAKNCSSRFFARSDCTSASRTSSLPMRASDSAATHDTESLPE